MTAHAPHDSDAPNEPSQSTTPVARSHAGRVLAEQEEDNTLDEDKEQDNNSDEDITNLLRPGLPMVHYGHIGPATVPVAGEWSSPTGCSDIELIHAGIASAGFISPGDPIYQFGGLVVTLSIKESLHSEGLMDVMVCSPLACRDCHPNAETTTGHSLAHGYPYVHTRHTDEARSAKPRSKVMDTKLLTFRQEGEETPSEAPHQILLRDVLFSNGLIGRCAVCKPGYCERCSRELLQRAT